jgi:dATP pyrophosphohydrolase
MPRAPTNVLVFPYRHTAAGGLEFAIFRRADADCWQGLAGGAEQGESAEEAARREVEEETGCAIEEGWIFLDAVATVPVSAFAGRRAWGPDVYVVTEWAFGVAFPASAEVTLSAEHREVRWLRYAEASALLRWDSNRTALWELNERLAARPRRSG